MSDSVTGLYYSGARWYDPAVGRFVTQDTNSGSQKDPLTMNRYIYARDNPMKYVDPTGHMFYADADGGAVKVSIVSGIITTAFTSASSSTTAVSSGGSTTYTMTTTSTTVTCVGGSCTTSTSYSYTTWTTMSNPTETGQGGAEEPTIGTSSVGSQVVDCLEHWCGAIIVTGAMAVTSVALSLATVAAATGNLFLPDEPVAVPATVFLGTLAATGWDSTMSMVSYDYQYGSEATPGGALQAGGSGLIDLAT